MGFMCFEVCLIQMLTLFLGDPTHSLSVTLFGLLVFSGLGSLASQRQGQNFSSLDGERALSSPESGAF